MKFKLFFLYAIIHFLGNTVISTYLSMIYSIPSSDDGPQVLLIWVLRHSISYFIFTVAVLAVMSFHRQERAYLLSTCIVILTWIASTLVVSVFFGELYISPIWFWGLAVMLCSILVGTTLGIKLHERHEKSTRTYKDAP